MKNRLPTLLSFVSVLFLGFLIGFFIGRNHTKEAILISLPPQMLTAPSEATETSDPITFPIDINTATQEEFEALPRIGETLAFRIISYRRERGKFKTIYDLLKVEGVTKSILTEIEELIYIGGTS